MKPSKLSMAILLAISTSSVLAENTKLEQVIVSATNTKQTLNTVTSNTVIITKEDIEKKQYQTLADALKTVPGITLKGSGGLGKPTSLFMRGSQTSHVLILQDGVDLTDAAGLGGAHLENIFLANHAK